MDKFLTYTAEKRAKLLKQIEKLNNEVSRVDEAERIYRASGAAGPEPELFAPDDDASGKLVFAGRTVLHGTIKDRVVAILGGAPEGLTSGQILEKLNADGGPKISRESLSPQLTRLKKDDRKIWLDAGTGIWRQK